VAFSLVAHFPQGTYRGRRPDLTTERIPSVARLHAALLCAAGFGPRAVEHDQGWAPCDADDVALRWLEENPPTEVRIPQLRVSRNDAVAYRDDGTIGKTGKEKAIRKLPKLEATVALDGPFVWTWRQAPPEPVAAALRELCQDVPHLGAAQSPVLLSATDENLESTHEHAPGSALFGGGLGHDIDLPLPGRVDELGQAHRNERLGVVGKDRAGTDERSLSAVPPRQSVRRSRYREIRQQRTDVPWPQVLLVPLDVRIAERDRVRWAVAAHRALIRYLDASSPPVLTGAYPDDARRPPNRVALHIIDKDHPAHLPGRAACALAVLLPREANPAELDAVYGAVGALRTLRSHRRRNLRSRRDRREENPELVRVTGPVEVIAGDRFWNEPRPGSARLWRTEPPAVPDTRGYPGWTFTHAALLSLGFVWQGVALPTSSGRGAVRDRGMVHAVNAAGAVVLRADPVRSSRVEDYVHRVHRDAVVRPYRATLSLGDVGGPTTIQAIGQCRHLGGGLLVPEDHDEGALFGEETG